MDHLLPDKADSVRCAPYTEAAGFDPVGTAIRADQLFLLELELPWPKPVRDHPSLLGMMDVVGGLETPSRLLATVPAGLEPRLIRFRRSGGSATQSTYPVESDLAKQLERLGTESNPSGRATPMKPAVLVCVQGSHDVCCGADGERFARMIEQRHPNLTVHRVSHTGGHRFAPTGMTLPDGRMWAHLDAGMVDALVAGADMSPFLARCRGWWGAKRGVAQAAERSVAQLVGPSFSVADRTIAVAHESGSAARCLVSAGSSSWEVDVSVARMVPTISCRSPGGRPATPAPEYLTEIVTGSGLHARR